MPELPEVETIRIGLDRLLVGKVVSSVKFDWPKGFPNSQAEVNKFLLGAKIVDISRRAKVLIINLSTRYSLLIHLKMTGQLVFSGEVRFGAGHPSESLVGKLPDKSTRVQLRFADKSQLFFNDQRKFGWMRLVPTNQIQNIDFMKKLGPEPLDDSFTETDFRSRLIRRKNSPIKAALLDQSVLAGVGNIYADESLWVARIHPATPVGKLSTPKINNLYRALREVLALSIKLGGSTDRNYVDAEGKKGSYLSFAKVFRLDGQPCPRCGTTIIKIRVVGRGTHICPKEQRLVK